MKFIFFVLLLTHLSVYFQITICPLSLYVISLFNCRTWFSFHCLSGGPLQTSSGTALVFSVLFYAVVCFIGFPGRVNGAYIFKMLSINLSESEYVGYISQTRQKLFFQIQDKIKIQFSM